MSDDGYVLEVKPSARKRSAEAGEWVNLEGTRRRFDSKALAREWARACSSPGSTVWVQDAVPWDDDQVDGYLVARSGAGHAVDGDEPGDQTTLDGEGTDEPV